jgi:DNA-directed RNA polymerase subunit L
VFNGIEVENVEDCNMCGACSDYSEEAIQVSEVADKFILTIESWGQLTPKEILAKAVESVSKDLDEVKLK